MPKHFQRALITLLAAVILVIPGEAALAQSLSQPPPKTKAQQNNASIVVMWIDARGNIFPGGKIQKMKWVWSKSSDTDPVESPALRIWLQSKLPRDWRPEKISADGVTVIEPFSGDETQNMTVDVRSGKAKLRFEFVDSKEKPIEMTLSIQVKSDRPYLLTRPECAKDDLRISVRKSFSKNMFVGLNCIDRGDRYDIYFFRSKESAWSQEPGLVQFDPEGKFTALKYSVSKPKDQVVYTQKLFSVGVLDEQKRESEYSIFYHPKVPPKKFYMSAGLGTTYYQYKEDVNDIELSQISLTGKVNLGYRLVPKVLDVALNAFGNVVTLTHSTSASPDLEGADIPTATFYGINGRLGYRLPVDLGATEFMFLTGWYLWGMKVPDDFYGIRSLSGPQLFLSMANSQVGHAGWWTYLKFAMISEKLQISNLSNREIAIGGGIELSASETKPFSLTLDIAQAQYSNDSNGMKLLSITAGIQKSF